MRLLIDADVLLDVLLNRDGFIQASSQVWKLCEAQQAVGYVSARTFADIVPVIRRELSPEGIKDVLLRLRLIFEFTELSPTDLKKASEFQWDDFEAALLSVTAERIHADAIITRKIQDFNRSALLIYTPEELLALY